MQSVEKSTGCTTIYSNIIISGEGQNMENSALYLWLSILAFVVIFITGFILHGKGKPYNQLLLALHKLIPLGVGAILIILAVGKSKMVRLPTLQLVLLIVELILLVATIITGGLISVKKEMPKIFTIIHKILPYLTLAASFAFFYFTLFA